MNIRKILHTLRVMREHCARVKVDAKRNFKAAIRNGGGSPKAWKQRSIPH